MTRDVPRSGWMRMSASGGPARSAAPTMVQRLVMRAWWLAIQVASTMAIRTLATSENWNWSPKMVTQRETPPMPVPMAMVITSSPRLMRYSSHEKVRDQR